MSDESESAGAAPAKGNSKILPIMLVFNTLLIVGVLVFVMKKPSAQAAATSAHGDKKDEHGEAKSEHGEAKGEHGEGKGEHGGAGEGSEGEGGPGPTLRLDAFVVQVRTTEGDRYAHATLEIEVGSEGDKKSFESRMPRVRDAIIGYLSDRTEDELRGSEGLAQVKEALHKKLDEIVPGKKTRGIFVTEFIIQ